MNQLAKLVDIPLHSSEMGVLGVIEKSDNFPFEPKRAYFILNVPGQAKRGFHGHRNLEQVMVAIQGSISVTVDDGKNRSNFTLDSPSRGLHILPGAWREMANFSHGSVLLVVASQPYDEHDYIRSYEEFLSWRGTE